jgi:iron(III) transport system permease protein
MAVAPRPVAVPSVTGQSARPSFLSDALLTRLGLAAIAAYLLVTVALPLFALLSRSVEDRDGRFVGLANFGTYFATPALTTSLANSLTVAAVSTVVTVGLAFGYAYAIARSCMPWRGLFKNIAFVPILAPSLLPAIALVYLFGKQGMIRGLLLGGSVYGPIGIVMGEVFWTFPHAFIIVLTALSLADARLYEAATALNAGPVRTFFTVTLPGIKYGLLSACFVVFTLVITDFSVPKVIGGQYNVLAVDVYKQVVGQQNFEMGAVVGLILLVPAVLAFAADRIVQRRQVALLSARAVPYQPTPSRPFDLAMLLFCTTVAFVLVGVIGVAGFASLAKFWPYDLTLSLKHYRFDLMDGGGWASFANSLEMAGWTAVVGTGLVFVGAYLVEKTSGLRRARGLVQFMCLLPLAVPGLVLGISYIFFFNAPWNPLGFLYHTMAILVISTVTHFYTVAHLTALTALKQLDPEFEAVSASLKVPMYRTFARVTVPVCVPAILDISIYLFTNAMTTVSAAVFLYSPDTRLASVAVLNMDDAGDIAPAAAMGVMIVLTCAAARALHLAATRGLARRAQAWRAR